MTLLGFQRAMAALVASPDLCLAARRDPAATLARFDLTARELHRLGSIVWQRGMSTNCSLYRSNRLTPLYTHLPLTCTLLGAEMMGIVERFWRSCEITDLQFQPEVERFAEFLGAYARTGDVDDRLESVLGFEVAVNALLYAPRRVPMSAPEHPSRGEDDGPLALHPLVRVARFGCDPAPLLAALASRSPPPVDVARREHYLLVRARADELEIDEIDSALGRVLWRLQTDGPGHVSTGHRASLLAAGVAVCADGPAVRASSDEDARLSTSRLREVVR